MMNNKLKKLIAATLTINALCTIAPTTSLFYTKAYASNSYTKLDDIDVNHGHIKFSSNTESYKINVSKSVDEIEIKAKPKESASTVKIDGTQVDNSNDYKKNVNLSKGTNTIEIKVEYNGQSNTYKLKVYRGSHHSDDNVYLDKLKLSDGHINFDKNDTSYDVDVNPSVDSIKITAEPDSSDDTVEIDGHEVNNDDDYKRTVSLNKGKMKLR